MDKLWNTDKCLRCGDKEFRIDGYCSIYCRDMAEVEEQRDAAEARLEEADKVIGDMQDILHRSDAAGVWIGSIYPDVVDDWRLRAGKFQRAQQFKE